MRRVEYEWIPEPAAVEPQCLPQPHAGSISACLVVRNEEGTIGRCLESLAGVADEIIVVHDGPCADRTLDIAAQYGCRVIQAPFYGHCERHTPLAYAEATGEWILNLDGDEFLSPALKADLRRIVRDPGVDGYAFLWKHWDGHRYVTEAGPFKLVLFRRRATRMIGIIHAPEEVDGAVRRIALHLEHRPPDGHRRVRSMFRKWRQRGRLQAREYLTSLEDVPRFNYPGSVRWTRRRELATRLSPLLIVPASLHTFVFVLSELWKDLGPGEALRFASTEAAYRAIVTAYVAWYRYVRLAK